MCIVDPAVFLGEIPDDVFFLGNRRGSGAPTEPVDVFSQCFF